MRSVPLQAAVSLAAWLLSFGSGADALSLGYTLPVWDCCKPACAWNDFLTTASAQGYVKVCNKSDATLTRQQSLSERSTCGDNPGNGFLCSIYSPRPVSNTLSYAFAVTTNRTNCCKCFQLHWTDGPATGKSAIVQAINIDDDVPTIYPGQQFGILTAGGGGYNHPEGCLAQYNAIWGRAMGGIYGPKDCEKLPSALQGSCYWRWNWVGGDMIGWPVAFDQVECPSELTSVSGCSNF